MSGERDPETIQADIRQTREELGDTAAALGYKSDVKARAGDRVNETKERISGVAEDAAAKAQEAMPSSARDGAEKARELVRQQPIATAAVAAFVVGVLVGRRRAGR
jgi:ElaB/YqjD/DUF883 family membrane-anchored ribosome-binding protein